MLSKKQKDALIIIGTGVLFGLAYALIADNFRMDAVLNGICIGLLGSSFIVLNEVVINNKEVRLYQFRYLVIYKTLVYSLFFSLIVPIVISVSRSLKQGISLQKFIQQGGLYQFIFKEDYFTIITYALIGTSVFIFTYQMSRKMGQGVLWGFITGKYHLPREEEHVLMYLDMSDSTAIAEDLGEEKFNRLLSKFFFDITDSILENRGWIYRYVGDEIAVTWKVNSSFKLDLPINTFIGAMAAIESEKDEYLRRFGLIPKFTAGLHAGNVVVGEIGEVKSQICFLGKALHETAVIEKACKQFNSSFLLSEKVKSLDESYEQERLHKVGEVNMMEDMTENLYSVKMV